MAKLQLPKLAMRVRFPLPAPTEKGEPRALLFLLERVTVAKTRRKRQSEHPLSNLYTEFAELAAKTFPLDILSRLCYTVAIISLSISAHRKDPPMKQAAYLKFMTFNLRVDNIGDGINSFTNRFNRVVEVLEQERPAVIGFQEVTDGMRARLRDHLPGYTVQGCGREANYHGESMLIAYRTDEIELLSLDNLWLSPTPRVAGSTFGGDQSACPRMLTTALLKHNAWDKPFRFVNTHLDHKGANARYLGAMELVQLISTYGEKFVLTGDFNATPDTPEIRLITSALRQRGTVDCTRALGGTFHDFGRRAENRRVKIDYIFTDGSCCQAYIVPDIPQNGCYYSDHNAVCAMISLA